MIKAQYRVRGSIESASLSRSDKEWLVTTPDPELAWLTQHRHAVNGYAEIDCRQVTKKSVLL